MKVAISGSHGFVGSRLKEVLEGQGIEVLPITREMFYAPVMLSDYFKTNNPDWIINLAAYGNMINQDSIPDMINANILGAVSIISAALNVPFKAFVNVSTSSVLLNYETFYSATKGATERLVKAFVNQFKTPIVTIRPFSVYGPKEASFRFIPTVFRSCLNGEKMTLAADASHDWIYIDDLVNAIIDICDHIEQYKSQTFGIGTGRGTLNQDVVALIENITHRKVIITSKKKLRMFDTSIWNAQPSDYLVKTTLKEGLTKIYEQTKGNFKD